METVKSLAIHGVFAKRNSLISKNTFPSFIMQWVKPSTLKEQRILLKNMSIKTNDQFVFLTTPWGHITSFRKTCELCDFTPPNI